MTSNFDPREAHSLAYAQQGGPQPNVPKPTKADVQNVVQIISSDKAKTQAYCDLAKLEAQVKAAAQKNDSSTLQALDRQADALLGKLGPEYFKLMDGLEEVDPKSSEAKEFVDGSMVAIAKMMIADDTRLRRIVCSLTLSRNASLGTHSSNSNQAIFLNCP